MKTLIFLFILLIASFFCHAQDTTKRNISLLKESSKIDSLINSIISFSEGPKSSKKDSCFVLSLFKTKSDAGFISNVHISNHKQVISDFRPFWKNINCGYFELNGYLIFIYGDSFMKEFFSNTQTKKEFTFIKPTTQEAVLQLNELMSWAVFYKNNTFSWGVH